MDPLLSTNPPTLPSLLSLPVHSMLTLLTKNPTSVVVDGIPPIPTKLLEKIRQWAYVDLATLTVEQIQSRDDSMNYSSNSNQVVIIESLERTLGKRKAVTDIFTWVQSYSFLVAVLTSDKASYCKWQKSLVLLRI